MKYTVTEIVKVGNKIGRVSEIYDDVYLIDFIDDYGNLNKYDYGYFLEEEIQPKSKFFKAFQRMVNGKR